MKKFKKNLFLSTPNMSKKGTVATLCMVLMGLYFVVGCKSLAAQDKITFTWQVNEEFPYYYISFSSTVGEPFTINWGDGNIETKVCEDSIYTMALEHVYETGGKYTVTFEAANHNCRFKSFDSELCGILSFDLTGCSALTSLTFDRNGLTSLDLTGCSALTSLICNGNALTDLDLSDCVSLRELICHKNKLTSLNLNSCANMIRLNCSENQLQLSDLYKIQLMEIATLKFGTQNISPQTANIGEALFSDQAIFNGVFTNYVVYKNSVPAPESDYIIVDGKLKFNAVGEYTATMTNDAIVSDPDYPAKVIVDIVVDKTTVSESEMIDIQIYPNPTTGELRVTSYELQVTSIEVFDIYGRAVSTHYSLLTTHYSINISHLPAGLYFVKVYTENGVFVKKVIKK